MRCASCLPLLALLAVAALLSACEGDDGPGLVLPERDAIGADAATGDVCTPGKWYCLNMAISAQCNSAGDGPETSTTCDAGTACAPGTGVCVTQICAPNQTTCASGESFARCRPDGLDYLSAEPCGDGRYCVDGRCVLGSCLGNVMILLDRSGSMAWDVVPQTDPPRTRWTEVHSRVVKLVGDNPAARFGLTAFPTPTPSNPCATSSKPEIGLTTYNTASRFNAWFRDSQPYGATPLVQAIHSVRNGAEAMFGGAGGTLVVISDGEDTCAHADLADQPNLRISKLAKELEDATAALLAEHGVKTWVVGYNYQGDPAQLDAIARAGGTGRDTHLPAGTEDELSQALGAVVSDWKLCF